MKLYWLLTMKRLASDGKQADEMSDMSRGTIRAKDRAEFPLDVWALFIIAGFFLLLCDAWLLYHSARAGLWLVDKQGMPAPLDFSAFWAAGRLVVEGKAATAYQWDALKAVVEALSGRSFDAANYPIFYPPVFLLFIAPLGFFSYVTAAVVWITATLAAYLAAAYAILPRRTGAIIVALAAPAVLWCVCVGQNGLLSAGLIGGGLALLERRPVLAGVLFGALVFKPQFGLLIPFVLIASGNWRAFVSAAVTVIVLFVAAGAIFGVEIFSAFLQAMSWANDKLLNVGVLPWYKVQSFYGLSRALGLGATLAWTIHGILAIAAAAVTLALWRDREVAYELKAAALATVTLVLSPYSCVYDLPIVAMAVLFLLKDDARRMLLPLEIAGLGFAYVLPMFFPALAIPVGPFVYATLGAIIAWRAGEWWVRRGSNPGQLD